MPQSPIPHLDIVDQAGRRRRVHTSGQADTVADLARALGCRDGLVARIDGLAVSSARPLVEIGHLLQGAEVRFDEPGRGADPKATRQHPDAGVVDVGLDYAVVGGPSCRAWTPLLVGRHGIGRSPGADIRLVDGLAELHHAVLRVDATGAVTVTQLTGRVPLRLLRATGSSDPIGAASREVPGQREWMHPGDSLIVGSSRIEVRRRPSVSSAATGRGSLAPIPGDPWRLEVRRGPDLPRSSVADSVRPPDAEARVDLPAGTALVGAVVACVGALAVAALVHQAMFAVFALVGAVASAATWAVGAIGAVRRRRVGRRASARDRVRFVSELGRWQAASLAFHQVHHVEVVEVLTALDADRSNVWRHRMHRDGDGGAAAIGVAATGAMTVEVVVGRGTVRLAPPIGAPSCAVGDRDAAVDAVDVMVLVDDFTVLSDVAVPVRFEAGEVVAIRGAAEWVGSVLRSFVVQVAATVGPADLRIVVVGDASAWAWAGWLPHARSEDGATCVISPADIDRLEELTMLEQAGNGRSTLLLVDDPDLLVARTGPLRRFLSATGATTWVPVDSATTVPAVCRRTLSLSTHGGVEWVGGSASSCSFSDVTAAGLDAATACSAARALAPLVDPEAIDRSSAGLPTALGFTALDTVTSSLGTHDVVERWRAAGHDPDLRVPVGRSTGGVVEIDLVADGPHALVAGTTGSGKSELLRTWVLSMASRVSPQHVTFVLIDYKGGSTFDCCAQLPHTVGVVTDLDGGLARRALVSLDAELTRRERLLRALEAGDLTEYRRRAGAGADAIPRLVVVVDEFATLAHELPDFLAALVAIAQRGRSLGVHIVLATQRPAGVVTDDIRANTDLRIALRVNDASEARDVVGDVTPAGFPKSTPGRALLRVGRDDGITFQAARCTGLLVQRAGRLWVAPPGGSPDTSSGSEPDLGADSPGDPPEETTELAVAVDAIRRAAASMGIPAPRRPWLDPLPSLVDAAMVDEAVRQSLGFDPGPDRGPAPAGTDLGEPKAPHDAIGIVDDPRHQSRHLLRWDRAAGNLVLVGALGTGRTSTVVALAAAACRTHRPDRCHVYVVDAAGDRSLDALATVAHCGGVVRIGETERIERLLRRLVDEVDARSASADGASAWPETVLFVDGLGELRRSLDTIERLAALAMLDKILEAGPAVGIASCCTVDTDTAAPSLATAERWVFGADQRGVGSVPRHDATGSTNALPGRLLVASSGLEAQVALGAAGLAGLASRPAPSGPPDLLVLPSFVDPTALPTSRVLNDGGRAVRRLVVGLASDDLEPATLCVPDGDHIFIGGAGRTGTTTALERIAAAWNDCEPDGTVLRWSESAAASDPSADLRARLDALTGDATGGGTVLLLIDGAERVPDHDGLLVEIARGRRPAVTIAVAARLDVVRGAYGHWTREVARSRCGFVMIAPGDVDGDLLGAALPRRSPLAPRPGLAWMIDGRGHRLVQVAGRMPS